MTRMVNRALPWPALLPQVQQQITEFKIYLPLFTEVANPAMQPHHWAQARALPCPAPRCLVYCLACLQPQPLQPPAPHESSNAADD